MAGLIRRRAGQADAEEVAITSDKNIALAQGGRGEAVFAEFIMADLVVRGSRFDDGAHAFV